MFDNSGFKQRGKANCCIVQDKDCTVGTVTFRETGRDGEWRWRLVRRNHFQPSSVK